MYFNLFDRFGEFNEEKEEWIINDKIDKYLKYSTIHLLKVMTVQSTGQSFTDMWVNISKLATESITTFKLKEKLKRVKAPGTQETPTNEEFRKALLIAPKQNWIPRVFIDILEYIVNKKNLLNEKIDYKFKSIEHILSQKAEKKDWSFIENQEENWSKI